MPIESSYTLKLKSFNKNMSIRIPQWNPLAEFHSACGTHLQNYIPQMESICRITLRRWNLLAKFHFSNGKYILFSILHVESERNRFANIFADFNKKSK